MRENDRLSRAGLIRCMPNNPHTAGSPDDRVATTLRCARPVKAVLVVPKGENEFEIDECEVPDLESLDVIDHGFDPHGPCGPTYWRITASHYYSTMLTEKGVLLSISKLAR